MIRIALLMLCIGCPSMSYATPTAQARFEEQRAQGVHYVKRGQFPIGYRTLARLQRTKLGQDDYATVFYLGRAAFGINRIQVAFEMGLQARSLADTERKLNRVQEFMSELESDYGAVDFRNAPGSRRPEGAVYLENRSKIINAKKRMIFVDVKERLSGQPVRLPLRVYLPYGHYVANNIEFSIEEGAPTPVVDLLLEESEQAGGSNSALWWSVGIGGAVATVVGVAALVLLHNPEPVKREVLRLEAR